MNNQIFYFFYNFAHQSNFIDELIIFLANTLPYFVVFFAILYLLAISPAISRTYGYTLDRFKEIIFVFFTASFAWFLSYLFKNLFLIRRPFEVLSDIIPLLYEKGFSFPSGHATFFMALTFFIFLFHKKVGLLFIFFAILIGLARISLGVHYPQDIFAGFILGIFIAYLFKFLYNFLSKLPKQGFGN